MDAICVNAMGRPRERFESQRAARRALAHKRRMRHGRWPRVYRCDCGSFHLMKGENR